MLKSYINYLINHVMKSVYQIPNNTDQLLRRLMISYDKNTMSEENILNEFTTFLNTLTKIEKDAYVNHKINYITESVDIKPSNVLDIGAGTGEILVGIKNYYGLPKEKVYALDLQPIQRDDITVIWYDENMKIPFDDGSIDLIVMLSLLHHVPERSPLLAEVHRVLSPNGRVVIREHDDTKTRLYYIFIQLMHYVWYVYNNETRDPLVMMSRNETIKLFKSVGFKSHNYIKPVGFNIQKLYGEVYKKIN